jgi:hypothetical protein
LDGIALGAYPVRVHKQGALIFIVRLVTIIQTLLRIFFTYLILSDLVDGEKNFG